MRTTHDDDAFEERMSATSAVLFADVEGARALRSRLGSGADAVLTSSAELLREAASRHGGRAVEDDRGFAATFVTCRAAVDAAVAIRRGFQTFAEEGLRIRIGIDCGHDDAAVARAIARTGFTGQVLVASPVVERAGVMPGVQFLDRGERPVEGQDRPARVHEVLFSIRRERTRSPLPEGEAIFEGRERERLALREVLDRALTGAGAIVLITGASGYGKSGLAESAAREAGDRGFLALVGRCADVESPPEFMPLVEILRSAAAVVPREVFLDTLGAAAGPLAELVPELRGSVPEVALPDDEDERREALVEACSAFLGATSRRRPVALVLDDLQWADASSVLLLERTAERIGEMPAVVIGTYRDVEVRPGPLAAALDRLLAHPAVSGLTLGPPDADADAIRPEAT